MAHEYIGKCACGYITELTANGLSHCDEEETTCKSCGKPVLCKLVTKPLSKSASTDLNVWEHNPSDFTAEEFTELISKLGDRQLIFFVVSQILGRFEGAIPQAMRNEVNRRINPSKEENAES